jgi:RND family efflux transporter MFP subunit
MNKSALLGQLRIERGQDSPPVQTRRWPWLIIGLSLLAVAFVAALTWFLVARPDLTRIRTARAVAASGGAGQAGSLLDASGYVVARREATVSSKVTGKVVEVMIEEGQHVAAGQVIARLDDSNVRAALEQAQAQAGAAAASLKVAEVALADAGPRYERSRAMHRSGYLSDQGVEDAKATYDTARYNLDLARRQAAAARANVDVYRRSIDDTVVRAPFAGVVTAKAAQPGEIVAPVAGGGFTRTGIGTIVDMDSLEVQVDVAENFIGRVTQGMNAAVTLNAYPDWTIPAEVIAVIPTADRSKATVTVRVGLKVKDPRIVPEMGARVAFLGAERPGAAPGARSVTVPFDAVETEEDGQAVAWVIAEGKAQRRAVRLGARTPRGQILEAGVTPGETVAIGAEGHLSDGKGVRVISKTAKAEKGE